MKKACAIGMLGWILASAHVAAQSDQATRVTPEEFEAKLGYQTGIVSLSGGMATIRLPESFRFIGPEGSRRLLTQGWGNPDEATEGVLGMLIPAGVSPLSQDGWGVVITYDDDGYVNDSDASSIDYTKMLKEMQEGTRAANDDRQKHGFEPITLVGWAEPPSYDSAAHKLYWAKELAFGTHPEHTLNYNIRILGRRGVLVLNAVSDMSQLETIRTESSSILPAIDFNEGHRYADYIPGKDKAAAYGFAGLILGATAAKAGFFKVIWIALLGLKKLIIAAVIGIAAGVKRLLTGRRESAPAAEQAQ